MSDLKKRKAAKQEFQSLLNRKTFEKDWQLFFSRNPFVLSDSLPVELLPSDIRAKGRPGKAEPDFIFYPSSSSSKPIYGAIEIKKPSTKLFTFPRKEIITLTREIDTAVKQSLLYSKRDFIGYHQDDLHSIIIGNAKYAFVIAGLSSENSELLLDEIIKNQIDSLFPTDCQLFTYDALYELFKNTIPPTFFRLYPKNVNRSRDFDVSPGSRIIFPDGRPRCATVLVNYQNKICLQCATYPSDRDLINKPVYLGLTGEKIGTLFKVKPIKPNEENIYCYSLVELDSNIKYSNKPFSPSSNFVREKDFMHHLGRKISLIDNDNIIESELRAIMSTPMYFNYGDKDNYSFEHLFSFDINRENFSGYHLLPGTPVISNTFHLLGQVVGSNKKVVLCSPFYGATKDGIIII